MSDTVEIIKAVLAFVTVIFTGVMAYQTMKLNIKASAAAIAVNEVKMKAQEAATIVKEVKTSLAQTNTVVDTKLNAIHTLVNSQLGVQLKLNANNSRWRADMSGKPEDIKAADEAENLLREHLQNQSTLDAGKSNGDHS